MNEVLARKHYRRNFYGYGLLLVATLVVFRYLISSHADESETLNLVAWAISFLDNLLISFLVTIFIGLFLFWIRPELLDRALIEVIPPKEINSLLKDAAAKSKTWVFRGACGRYTRAVTLPALLSASKNHSSKREITICILDPKNDSVCDAYASYRNSLKSGDDFKWTKLIVQKEALATAISALIHGHSSSLFRVALFLTPQFSSFRIDISDEYAVVTKEDKQAPALRANANSFFYEAYVDEITLLKSTQSREVKLENSYRIGETLDADSLRKLIQVTDLFDIAHLDSLFLEEVLQAVNKPKNPYK